MSGRQENIHLTDNSDWERWFRWTDRVGAPYPLVSGKLQVRATEDAANPLINVAGVLQAQDWISFTITKEEVVAADFEALLVPAVYDIVIVRLVDNFDLRIRWGDVVWSRGSTR